MAEREAAWRGEAYLGVEVNRSHWRDLVRHAAVLLVLGTLTAGCATASPPAPSAPGPMAGAQPPSAENAVQRHLEVHWVRSSAEYRALTFQIYRDAGARIQALAPTLGKDWAVVMDGDDTVLDNSDFERRLAESGETFEESMWDRWVFEEAAGAVPGAVEFIHLVQSLGGRLAIVTNRDERLCPATKRNLEAIGVNAAVVLCETDTGEKEPRFRMVEQGTAAPGLPPLHIALWVGDNIRDFPGLDQSLREAPASALDAFGRRFFLVPNPMYGSWIGNPWH